MKKRDVVNAILEVFNYYKVHPEVPKEIIDLIGGSGREAQFFNQFEKATEQLKNLEKQVTKLNNFELLKNTEGIYSMHLCVKDLNLRMLYSYGNNGEILLHCFHERDDSKKDSYEKHIPIAKERKKEMEGGNELGE